MEQILTSFQSSEKNRYCEYNIKIGQKEADFYASQGCNEDWKRKCGYSTILGEKTINVEMANGHLIVWLNWFTSSIVFSPLRSTIDIRKLN